jgi:hypothetical protein
MKIMKERVSRMMARGFAKLSGFCARPIFGFPLLEKKIKIPIRESNRERISGKIAGPGWVNLPIGRLMERERKQMPTKRKNNPPARSLFIIFESLSESAKGVKVKLGKTGFSFPVTIFRVAINKTYGIVGISISSKY